MGYSDGAVNGMATRLAAAGFTPGEAICLAQCAYLPEGRRASGVPAAAVDRGEATSAINEMLTGLVSPFGAEAHCSRIRLWESVFGFGSWHEAVDPEEIYSPLELLAHGYRSSSRPGEGGTDAAKAAAAVRTQVPVERTFRVVVGGDYVGEPIDRIGAALEDAEITLRRIVESEDYVWNGDDVEYLVFTKGDRDLPGWIPGRALDRYPHGTPCATGVVTARRPG